MFAAFFYLLRQRGLNVSLNEWMTLLEGMEKGLHHSTLTGFYHLCRAVPFGTCRRIRPFWFSLDPRSLGR